jgi:geranylgeranyl pyrophosphate synthase
LPLAINTGDYLIGLGYRLVSRDATTIGAETASDILDLLANSHLRLCEGQGAELLWRDSRNKRLSPLDALKVYALKTAPAFEAALLTGVRLAGNHPHLTEPLRHFSRNVGVAFQIINDLNDWQGDQHNKLSAGGDVLGGRPTVLLALALAALPANLQAELLALVERRDEMSDLQRVQRVEALYKQANVFEQAKQLIDKHQARALESISQLKETSLKWLLQYLLDTVLERSETAPPVVVEISTAKGLPITSVS